MRYTNFQRMNTTEMSIIFVYCGYNELIVFTNILDVFVFVSTAKHFDMTFFFLNSTDFLFIPSDMV